MLANLVWGVRRPRHRRLHDRRPAASGEVLMDLRGWAEIALTFAVTGRPQPGRWASTWRASGAAEHLARPGAEAGREAGLRRLRREARQGPDLARLCR